LKESKMIGRVYLVGAGPGDPELLTIRAVRVLERADLVLHDDLVPESIVALAAPGAGVENVGKRCGKKSTNQDEINARMIAAARQGLTVVRLKGGDPSIFGRSGEEIEALRAAEVDFEIVPGVTAASAAAATAGISLTQRGIASSVVFLTGHHASGRVPEATREDLAGKTVVVYMPGPDYAALQARLVAAGIGTETPCLLVSAAGSAPSRVYPATVATLPALRQSTGPSILIVGDVTACGEMRPAPHPWDSLQSHWRTRSEGYAAAPGR
jgi:uroporphyrin-III C-methyltransferase